MPAESPRTDPSRGFYERLRARIEAFISGRAPDDPLYLSNRTWQQKLKTVALIGSPVVLLAALVMAAATDVFRLHKVDPFERPATESAAPAVPHEPLPEPTLTAAELEVVNIHILKDAHAPAVTGVVRNNSSRRFTSAEVSYYLADHAGSLLGTDTVGVQNLQPHSSTTFRTPLKEEKAEYVIVREVRPN